MDTAEAVRQLNAQISDQEVTELVRKHVRTNWNPDDASIAWNKRELAIILLYDAFCDGTLTTSVRSAAGRMVPLTGLDWRGMFYWRDVILGGIVRTVAGEQLIAYDGCVVVVDGFREWLDQRGEQRVVPADVDVAPEVPLGTAPAGNDIAAEHPAPPPPLPPNGNLSPRVQEIVALLDAMERERGFDPDTIPNKELLDQVKERLEQRGSTAVGMRTLVSALSARRERRRQE
jgi:hypothetical protein